MTNTAYNEHCQKTMQEKIPSSFVDMIVTSPPYAKQRKKTYGGISEEQYIEWFLPIAHEIKRVLKPTGSFFLNIKAHSKNSSRSLYVMKLVIALCEEVGFILIDEYCWQRGSMPGKFKNKFKNAWEPVFHFAIQPDINFYPEKVATIKLPASVARTNRKLGGNPKNGSGFYNGSGLRKSEIALPTNIIYAPNVINQHSDNKWHPAVFPPKLVEFFVKAFTKEGDVVYDPFAGSGTVIKVCHTLNRKWIASELVKGIYKQMMKDVKKFMAA